MPVCLISANAGATDSIRSPATPTAKGPAAAFVDMATDGHASSDGDIRVLLVLDLILSLLFSIGVVYGLDLVGLGDFTPVNVAVATVFLAGLTYVFVLR